MINRRKFISSSVLSSAAIFAGKYVSGQQGYRPVKGKAIVISTWDAGLEANKAAWKVLGTGGRALDAVEQSIVEPAGVKKLG